MTIRTMLIVLFVSFLLTLAGCSSEQLKRSTMEIDAIAAQLENGPVADLGRPLGPHELLNYAKAGGADFMSVRLEAQKARLQLDERKSGLLPRFGISLRRELTLGRGVTSKEVLEGASLAINWDLAAALLYGGRENIKITETYLPLQAGLAENLAAAKLFESYAEYEKSVLVSEGLKLNLETAQCRTSLAEVELDLGNVNRAEVSTLRSIETSINTQISAADRHSAAARREVLYLAGVNDNAILKSRQDPSRLFPNVPTGIGREECYEQSGRFERDKLLLAGATANVKVARLERFGRFDLFLPSSISPSTGLTLDILISLLVPLVDQGDGTRRIQEARLALLNLALANQRFQHQFDIQLATIATEMASATTEIAEVKSLMIGLDVNSSKSYRGCEDNLEFRKSELDLDRAQLALSRARTKLALLCTPATQAQREHQ